MLVLVTQAQNWYPQLIPWSCWQKRAALRFDMTRILGRDMRKPGSDNLARSDKTKLIPRVNHLIMISDAYSYERQNSSRQIDQKPSP